MFVTRLTCAVVAVTCLPSFAQEQTPTPKLEWRRGPLTLRPSGFFDWIGEWRSATTGESVWTHFGRIPLSDTPDQQVGSPGHSRVMLKGTLAEGPWQAAGYYEADFIDPNRKQPYRLRQAWGEVSRDGWHILAGKAWSLLRPNRKGMASDRALMNTDVVEPAYHVGLVGNRKQQIRVSKETTSWGTAFGFERQSEGTGGDFTWKGMHENGRLHVEAIALIGSSGRRAFSVAGVVPVSGKVRFITQEFVSHNAVEEALSLVPSRASGASFIQGVEADVTKSIELYSYGGLVYGNRSTGNRLVREWSIGLNQKMAAPGNYGSFVTGIEFSQLDRHVWTGSSGSMAYVQVLFRYNLW